MRRFISIFLILALIPSVCIYSSASENKVRLIDITGDEFNPVIELQDENENLVDLTTDETALVGGSTLPESYDSRTKNVITTVKDQSQSGACWAFATISTIEADAISKGLSTINSTDYSEAHLVDFTYSADKDANSVLYGESYNSESPYMLGGNWIRATGTLSCWNGVVNESSYPFDTTLTDYSNMPAANDVYRYSHNSGIIISDAEVLEKQNDIKSWIMEHGACAVSFNYKSDCYNEANSAYYCVSSGSNHMVSIIGWDDNFSRDNFNSTPSTDGAWLVKDSWGSVQRNNGYFWISYKDSTLCYCVGYNVVSDTTYDNNYTYNAVGYTAATQQGSGSKIANVYTTDDIEILNAVAFYTIDSNTTVNIEIYKDVDKDNFSTNSTPIKSVSVTEAHKGYHTVSLGNNIKLAKNTSFAVVLTYTIDGDNVMIPTENPNGTSNDSFSCTSQRGQSFACFDGNTWKDATDIGCGNFEIQALTSCAHNYEYTYMGNNNFEAECQTCHETTTIYNVGISLNATEATVYSGDTYKLTATTGTLLDSLIVFEVSDTSIAKIDENGNIETECAGTCYITAAIKDSDVTALFTLTVESAMEDFPKVCNCICHSSGIMGIFYKIIRIFWMLFSPDKQYCACGGKHW